MYYLLATLIGVLIAVMIAINGGLTLSYGVYLATVIIHVVGLVLIGAIVMVRREKLRPRSKLPFYAYIGGVVGVGTTVFNNLAFGHISVSALLALQLLGQLVLSVAVDQFGLFGMEKRLFNHKKLAGLALVAVGAAVMLIV